MWVLQAETWQTQGAEWGPEVAGWVSQYKQPGKLALLSLSACFKKEAKKLPQVGSLTVLEECARGMK